MSTPILGVNPTQVDTVALFTLGTETPDPRDRDFPSNIIRYVKANATGVTLGVAVRLDGTASDEPGSVIPTAATPTGGVVNGIAHVALPNQSFGWVTVHGKVVNAAVPGVVAAGVLLGGGADGALVDISTAPSLSLATAAASGRGVIMLEDTGTNTGIVWVE